VTNRDSPHPASEHLCRIVSGAVAARILEEYHHFSSCRSCFKRSRDTAARGRDDNVSLDACVRERGELARRVVMRHIPRSSISAESSSALLPPRILENCRHFWRCRASFK
jgi:hypothetical protein